jgi:hypothetical protein
MSAELRSEIDSRNSNYLEKSQIGWRLFNPQISHGLFWDWTRAAVTAGQVANSLSHGKSHGLVITGTHNSKARWVQLPVGWWGEVRWGELRWGVYLEWARVSCLVCDFYEGVAVALYCITSASRRVDGKYGNHFKTSNDQKKPYDSTCPAQMCARSEQTDLALHMLQRARNTEGATQSDVTTNSTTQILHSRLQTTGEGKNKLKTNSRKSWGQSALGWCQLSVGTRVMPIMALGWCQLSVGTRVMPTISRHSGDANYQSALGWCQLSVGRKLPSSSWLLTNKNIKILANRTIILAVVLYGCET